MSKTFLIVDDSYIDRLVATMLIKRHFATDAVYDVSGGQLALDWLRSKTAENSPIIILLDIMMPQMNGFQFLDQFDTLDESIRKEIIIVMLSSTLDEDDQRRAKLHPSVKKLLSKPLSPNELKVFL
jgi:CheY-like chemotaxis protein